MHQAVRDWVYHHGLPNLSVCELGSRDVNGNVRDLFPGWNYVGVDSRPGRGVDVVANAAEWDGDGRRFDVVISLETFEHCPDEWRDIVATAYKILKPGGLFICTAAGPGRPPHTCDGHLMHDNREPYGNIQPDELRQCLIHAAFEDVTVNVIGCDVRAVAKKPW